MGSLREKYLVSSYKLGSTRETWVSLRTSRLRTENGGSHYLVFRVEIWDKVILEENYFLQACQEMIRTGKENSIVKKIQASSFLNIHGGYDTK